MKPILKCCGVWKYIIFTVDVSEEGKNINIFIFLLRDTGIVNEFFIGWNPAATCFLPAQTELVRRIKCCGFIYKHSVSRMLWLFELYFSLEHETLSAIMNACHSGAFETISNLYDGAFLGNYFRIKPSS